MLQFRALRCKLRSKQTIKKEEIIHSHRGHGAAATEKRLMASIPMPALLVKTRRAPYRRCKNTRYYGHTTAAMTEISDPPPNRRFSALHHRLWFTTRFEINLTGEAIGVLS